MNEQPDYIKIREIVNTIGVNRKTVVGWIETGELPGKKIGGQYFIRREDFYSLFAIDN